MEISRLSSWLQIAGNFGVLLALVMVAVQINQTQALNRAEHGAMWFENAMQFDAAAMGESYAAVVAKAAVESAQLTQEELAILDFGMDYKWNQLSRAGYLVSQGILREDLFLVSARREGRRVFGQTLLGKAWYQERIGDIPKERLAPWQIEIAQEISGAKWQMPPNHCMQPTPQTVIKFAHANLSPVWGAADAGC